MNRSLEGKKHVNHLVLLASLGVLSLTLATTSCSKDSATAPTTQPKNIEICDPSKGPFALTVDNPYLPFEVGTVHELEGLEGGTDPIRLRFTVLDETEVVVGVTTRVVEELVWLNGSPDGTQRRYVAQAPDGTVCAFGTQGGGTEEEWMAGVSGAIPSVMMPAQPAVGMVFDDVYAPPDNVSTVEITSTGDEVKTTAGTFTDTVTLLGEELGPTIKKYARGVGLIYDDGVELITY